MPSLHGILPVLDARKGAIGGEGVGLTLEQQEGLNGEADWDGVELAPGEQIMFRLSGTMVITNVFVAADGDLSTLDGNLLHWSVADAWIELLDTVLVSSDPSAWFDGPTADLEELMAEDSEEDSYQPFQWLRFTNDTGSAVTVKSIHLYGDPWTGDDTGSDTTVDDEEEEPPSQEELDEEWPDVDEPDLEFLTSSSTPLPALALSGQAQTGTSEDTSFRVKVRKGSGGGSITLTTESLTPGSPAIDTHFYFSLDGTNFYGQVTVNVIDGGTTPLIHFRRVTPHVFDPLYVQMAYRIVAYYNDATTDFPSYAPPDTNTGFRLGVNWQPLHANRKNDPELRAGINQKMVDAGVQYVRMDMAWDTIQPVSAAAYSASGIAQVEKMMTELYTLNENIKILLMVYWPPKWTSGRMDANGYARKNGIPGEVDGDYQEGAEAYGTFLAWCWNRWGDPGSDHYRGVFAIEMWNEPDLPDFWHSESAVNYANMIKWAYPVAKAAAPDCIFVLGAATYTNTDWMEDLYAVSGFQGNYDAIAFHPYMSASDDSPDLANTGTPYRLRHVEDFIDLMDSEGDTDIELWATEYGWSAFTNTGGEDAWARGVSESTQAEYLILAHEVMTEYPRITAAFWYNIHDAAVGNIMQDSYGLLRSNLSAKPAFEAWKTVNTAIIYADEESDPPESPPDFAQGFALKFYGSVNFTEFSFTKPHLWALSPKSAANSSPITLYGFGVGEDQESFDSAVAVREGFADAYRVSATYWNFYEATGDAYGPLRQIVPGGTIDPEHVRLVASVPAGASAPIIHFALRTADGYTPIDRGDITYGGDEFRPDATNTGHIGTLTTHSGNYTTTEDGEEITDLDITGRLIIEHADVVVTNCRIQGGTPSGGSFGSVKAFDCISATFTDCTIMASVPTVGTVYNNNGIQGKNFTMYRCDISGTVDGIGAQVQNVEIYGCWIHDMVWHEYDPAHVDGTHSDGIQIHGGTGYILRGNSIEMGTNTNAAIMINQDGTGDIIIDKNWIVSTSNCASGINLADGGTAMTGVEITDNRFSAANTWDSKPALVHRSTYDIATISGNVYIDTDLPITVQRVNLP